MNIQELDFTIDLLTALIWEYDAAPNLTALLTKKNSWYQTNQSDFWNTWANEIFSCLYVPPAALILDPDTYAFGLAVWSIILDLPLQMGSTPDPAGKPIFGFNWISSAGTGNQNFWRSNFSNGNVQPVLTIDQQQLILRLRYFNLTTRGDILDINKILKQVFPGVTGFTGTVYCLDTYQMQIQYIFTGSLSQSLKFILQEYDILPRPAGVEVKIYSNIDKLWGVNDETNKFNQNFGNGSFIGA